MEGQGEGWCWVGGELFQFISEGNGIGCVSKKASLINVHSFIAALGVYQRRHL